jgi:hypothetical protein
MSFENFSLAAAPRPEHLICPLRRPYNRATSVQAETKPPGGRPFRISATPSTISITNTVVVPFAR